MNVGRGELFDVACAQRRRAERAEDEVARLRAGIAAVLADFADAYDETLGVLERLRLLGENAAWDRRRPPQN